MKKTYYLIFFAIIFLTFKISAQTINIKLGEADIFSENYTTSENAGVVNIIQDKRLNDLFYKYILYTTTNNRIYGWRVQIFFSSGHSSREKAEEQMNKFKTLYPEVEAYLRFDNPFFKVRVGDFRNKQEALKFKRLIRKKFPNTWIVEDDISFPEINRPYIETKETAPFVEDVIPKRKDKEQNKTENKNY